MIEFVGLIVPVLFLSAGIALVVWRTPIALWNKRILEQLGRAAAPSARGSRPSTMVVLGVFFIATGTVALAFAINGIIN